MGGGGTALSVSLRLTAPPKGELLGGGWEGSYLPLWGRWHGEAVTERAVPHNIKGGNNMPSNQTPNYALNQWERDDRILMEDFNEDNAKIDTALAGLEETAAGHTAALSRRGNCQIYTTSYVGNGKYGQANPITLTFPRKPLLVIVAQVNYGAMIVMPQGCAHIMHTEGNRGALVVTWQGNSVSWWTSDNSLIQMSEQDKTYMVVAFCAMD